MTNTYAVDLHRIAVYVKTDGAIETFTFKTRKQADKKLLELIKGGYRFDPMMYALEIDQPAAEPHR